MHNALSILATAISLSLLSINIYAAPATPAQPADPIKMMDRDGDDRVSKQEYIDASMQRINDSFKQADLNSDGYVSREEQQIIQERMQKLYQQQMQNRAKP